MRDFLFFWSLLLLLVGTNVKAQVNFSSEQIISTELKGAVSVRIVDMDNDGDLDVLASGFFHDRVVWYKNDGNSNFYHEYLILDQYDPPFMDMGDLDNDGDIDVLSTRSNSFDDLYWYENDGSGGFENRHIALGTNIVEGLWSYNISDLDHDGNLDILIVSLTEVKLSWIKNDGNGNFGSPITIEDSVLGLQYTYVSDLDRDGLIDIIVSSDITNQILWYKNNGNGNFSEKIILAENIKDVKYVYAADLDEDGDMDVLCTDTHFVNNDYKIIWFKNDGQGVFGNENFIECDVKPKKIYTVDFDNDGDLDILSYGQKGTWGHVFWIENKGNGNFGVPNNITDRLENILSLDVADIDQDGDMDVFSASSYDDKLAWYRNFFIHQPIISFVYSDSNENGVYDGDDFPLYRQELLLNPINRTGFTEDDGYLQFFAPSGEYQLTSQYPALWELTTIPETYDIDLNEDTEIANYYFGFKPTRILPRVEPHLNSSPTRCSTQSTYWLHYSNTGTTIANGTITLETDELMEFISSNPEPDAIEGHNLIWHFSELYPSFENKIELQFQMPDFNSMGEILETQASLQLFNENEELVYSKSTDYNSEVLCSYDPNDKLVRSNLLGQSETAYISDTLLYTVRFQNTGNDTAFNIRIEDVLDKTLDWTTFHPITASHDYRTELNRETGLATFYFDDIMLLDSTTNEPESHGFVLFGIASLPDIGDKTEVENTASIYFDFNPPIVTNTVSTVLVELDDVSIGNSILDVGYSILIRPNPFSDYTMIEVEGLPEGDYELEVMDILGRKLRTLTLEEGEVRLEREKLESGVYFFRVFEKGNFEVIGGGKVLVQ